VLQETKVDRSVHLFIKEPLKSKLKREGQSDRKKGTRMGAKLVHKNGGVTTILHEIGQNLKVGKVKVKIEDPSSPMARTQARTKKWAERTVLMHAVFHQKELTKEGVSL